MSEFLPLLRTLLIAGVLSALALKMLSRPLSGAVLRLAPQHPAALFWLRYAQLVLAGVPLAAGLVMDLLARRLPPDQGLQLTLAACLVGVIVAGNTVGQRVERLAAGDTAAPSGPVSPTQPGARAEWRLGS